MSSRTWSAFDVFAVVVVVVGGAGVGVAVASEDIWLVGVFCDELLDLIHHILLEHRASNLFVLPRGVLLYKSSMMDDGPLEGSVGAAG